MGEIVLTRTAEDRRLYALGDIGTVRFKGWLGRSASAEANGRTWAVRRGGTLHWLDRELALRPVSRWRERYALGDGVRELAVIAGQGWGRRPVTITLDDPRAVDPGLLLFAAFVVRGVAQDASGGE